MLYKTAYIVLSAAAAAAVSLSNFCVGAYDPSTKSYYPKAVPPTHLYVIKDSVMNAIDGRGEMKATIATLQGLLAKSSGEQVINLVFMCDVHTPIIISIAPHSLFDFGSSYVCNIDLGRSRVWRI